MYKSRGAETWGIPQVFQATPEERVRKEQGLAPDGYNHHLIHKTISEAIQRAPTVLQAVTASHPQPPTQRLPTLMLCLGQSIFKKLAARLGWDSRTQGQSFYLWITFQDSHSTGEEP